MNPRTLFADAEYLKEIEWVRRDLRALISNKRCAPIMLRLAWHDAATYDARLRIGGPNGSIRFERVYTQKANSGLKIAMDLCEEVKAKHPIVSYSDLYQLAGVVAVEVTGGPNINFVPGRKESTLTPHVELPDPKKGASHLRHVFYRLGLSDKEIVALSGAHTLGKAHPERSGFDEKPWTKDPLKFDNSYFVELLKGDTDGLLKLPTDKALVEDPMFRCYVELYAKDEEAFFNDYAESHKKFSEFGFIHPPPPCPKSKTSGAALLAQYVPKFNTTTAAMLAQFVVGIAIVVILSFFYEVNRKIS